MSNKFKKLALLGLTVLTAQGLSADEDNSSSSGVNVGSEVLLAGSCGAGSCGGGRKANKKGNEIADNDYRPVYQPANQATPPPAYTTRGCEANRGPNASQGRNYYSNDNQGPSQGSSCQGASGAPQPTSTSGCQGMTRPEYGTTGRSWNSPYADNSQPTSNWNKYDTQMQPQVESETQPQPSTTPSGNYGRNSRNTQI